MKHISEYLKKYQDLEIVLKISDIIKIIEKNETKKTKSIQSKCKKV